MRTAKTKTGESGACEEGGVAAKAKRGELQTGWAN